MNVAMIDYGAGNTLSVRYALNRLGIEPVLTDVPEEIMHADRVIFPGVGEAATAMQRLRNNGLDRCITDLRQPVLGICLGLQLLCQSTEEQNVSGLGVFSVRVRKFKSSGAEFPVPHMGWNTIRTACPGSGFADRDGAYFFFVHSYYAEQGPETCATCTYMIPFSAILQKDNFTGVQFHPEKSGPEGEEVLRTFLDQKF